MKGWFLRGAAALLLAVAAPAGTVQLLDGTRLEGELSIDNGLTVRGDKVSRLAWNTVLRASFKDQAEEVPAGLALVNGARLAGVFAIGTDGFIRIEASKFAVPSTEVAWLVYQPFSGRIAAQIPLGKTGALLPGGDFFEGSIRSPDAGGARVLNPIFGPRVFDGKRKEMSALVLRDVNPPPAAYEIVKNDGSVYVAQDISASDPKGVVLRHPLYDNLKIDANEIVEIRAAASRYLALDTLKPLRVDPPAGTAPEQAFAAGKTIEGGAFKIQGKEARGLASLANTAVTWELPANAAVFVARVMPASTAAEKVVFAVYADGKPVARSAALGATDAPALLRCAIPPGARLLSLRVEGKGGSGLWGEPVLLRR